MTKYFRIGSVALICLYFWHYASTYTEWHFIDSANIIFHEAGHVIFSFFGEFIHIAAGSGFQIALPLFISLYFFFDRQMISGALCLLWVGQNMLNVSMYAGDAVATQLPLLGGDGSIHDWHYLLAVTGKLDQAASIAGTIYTMGIITMTLGTMLSFYFAWVKKKLFHK